MNSTAAGVKPGGGCIIPIQKAKTEILVSGIRAEPRGYRERHASNGRDIKKPSDSPPDTVRCHSGDGPHHDHDESG
jgi:hypothetical protein